MSKKAHYRRDIMDEITETVAQMIISGGNVTVKHQVDRHDRPIIVVTCQSTFYMGED